MTSPAPGSTSSARSVDAVRRGSGALRRGWWQTSPDRHSSWLADMAEESEDAALPAQACVAATRGEAQPRWRVPRGPGTPRGRQNLAARRGVPGDSGSPGRRGGARRGVEAKHAGATFDRLGVKLLADRTDALLRSLRIRMRVP